MSQYHTNKKLTKPVVPRTTDTKTVVAKRLMRRILLEKQRGLFIDHDGYFDSITKYVSDFINSHRAFNKFLSEFDQNLGNENNLDFAIDTLNSIKDYDKLDSENHVFSRKFMNKSYGINKGITVSVGDVWLNNGIPSDKLKYEIIGVGFGFNSGKINGRLEAVVMARMFCGVNERSKYVTLPLYYLAGNCSIYNFNVPEFISIDDTDANEYCGYCHD